MGKEVKIGLAVIGALLCVFGGVLAMRLKREQPANALEKVAAAEKEGKIVGKKKPGSKPARERKDADRQSDEPALDGSLATFTSRRRGGVRDGAENQPKTDRYGRPLAEEGWSMPAEGDSQDDVAEASPSGLPDLSDSEYGKRGQGDRYSRYSDAEPQNVAPDSVSLTDGRAEDGENAEDLAMPADRFAQPTHGVSFNDLESANDESANDADGDPDQDDAAPRFSLAQPEDRFASNGEVAGKELEEAADLDQDGGGIRLAPVPDEEDDVRTAGRDRYEPREQARSLSRGRAIGADETLDDTAEPLEDAVAESPRRFRQPDADTYTVEPNDNFWRISQKVYGTGAYFKALEEHNRRQAGDRPLLSVGDAISTPLLSDLQQTYPDLCPKQRKLPVEGRSAALVASAQRGGKTYTVGEGDTLFDIARAELGKASRWAEIYELNRDQLGDDFNYLAPGMRLVMPPRGERTESTATRPERDSYRR